MINRCIKNISRKATYFIRQKIINHIKWETQNKINTKNRIYYFCNDIINLKKFKLNLLKIDKKII